MTIEAYLGFAGGTATLYLAGEPDAADLSLIRDRFQEVTASAVNRLVLRVLGLSDLPAAALRALAVTAQQGPAGTEVIVVQPSERLEQSLIRSGLDSTLTVVKRV